MIFKHLIVGSRRRMRPYFWCALIFFITFLGKRRSCVMGLIFIGSMNAKTKKFCSKGFCHRRGLLVDESSV